MKTIQKCFISGAVNAIGYLMCFMLIMLVAALIAIPVLSYLFWNIWYAIPIELFLIFFIGFWDKLIDAWADISVDLGL